MPVNYGISRLRPLLRRLLSTRRPARVLILSRNPWVLARFLLFGLKVGSIVNKLQKEQIDFKSSRHQWRDA